MARRRRVSDRDGGIGKPLVALALLGLLYLAFQFGLLNLIGELLMSILQPDPTG